MSRLVGIHWVVQHSEANRITLPDATIVVISPMVSREAHVTTVLKVHPILEKHGKWYVGYVPEVPGVNTQECILKAARSSLMMALHELAEMDPQAVMGGQTAE